MRHAVNYHWMASGGVLIVTFGAPQSSAAGEELEQVTQSANASRIVSRQQFERLSVSRTKAAVPINTNTSPMTEPTIPIMIVADVG